MQLQAVVPGPQMAALGWSPIEVASPAPGGGTSNALPFSVYTLVSLTANHILYDPYTRLLYASVNWAATQVAGNTIVAINPATGGFGTPVNVGSQPSSMALTSDGEFLYVNLTGSSSVGHYNMLTQSLDFSFPITMSSNSSFFTVALRDIATVPGTDTSIAVDKGEDAGSSLWTVNPALKTGTLAGNNTGSYTGSSLQFLNPTTLFTFDIDTTGNMLDRYAVGASGLTGSYSTDYTLNSFSAFKIRGGWRTQTMAASPIQLPHLRPSLAPSCRLCQSAAVPTRITRPMANSRSLTPRWASPSSLTRSTPDPRRIRQSSAPTT